MKYTKGYDYVLNQVCPGILSKLGNIPYILVEPLTSADFFFGLDISRITKLRTAGTNNAVASTCVYDNRGKEIGVFVADNLIDGEIIPKQVLTKLMPESRMANKTIMGLRDGLFRKGEAQYLADRAKAINSKIILVEIVKSFVPRLFDLSKNDQNNWSIGKPLHGLKQILSSREAILVTTDVPERIGVPQPIRVRIHEAGYQVNIEAILEDILKLTLLHYGALKEPRLPVPLFISDRIAYLRLYGIFPRSMNGKAQYWH